MPDFLETAAKECARWQMREERILAAIRDLDDERGRIEEEFAMVDQQVGYYESLTRDMKREFGRPSLSSLLSSLRKT